MKIQRRRVQHKNHIEPPRQNEVKLPSPPAGQRPPAMEPAEHNTSPEASLARRRDRDTGKATFLAANAHAALADESTAPVGLEPLKYGSLGDNQPLPTSPVALEAAQHGLNTTFNASWTNQVGEAARANGGLGTATDGYLAWSNEGFTRLNNPNLTPEQNRKMAEISLVTGQPIDRLPANADRAGRSPSAVKLQTAADNVINNFDGQLDAFRADPSQGLHVQAGKKHYTLQTDPESGHTVAGYEKEKSGIASSLAPVIQVAGVVFAPVTGGASLAAAAVANAGLEYAETGKLSTGTIVNAAGGALAPVTGGLSTLAAQGYNVAEDGKIEASEAINLAASYYTGNAGYSANTNAVINTAAGVSGDLIDGNRISAATIAQGASAAVSTGDITTDQALRSGLVVGGRAIDGEDLNAADVAQVVTPLLYRDRKLSGEKLEARQIAEAGGATLVDVTEDAPEKATTFTLHGINDSTDGVAALSDSAAARGDYVATFAYDDRRDRLTTSSAAFADSIRKWKATHPGETLSIDAHSMGGRVALGALDELNQSGELDFDVKLRLVAPPLGGFEAANNARYLPGGVARLIPGANPGKDMGTTSDFQMRLEQLNLSQFVQTDIYLGSNDHIVDGQDEHFRRVAEALNARIHTLDGGTHTSVVDDVAARPVRRRGRLARP